MRSFFGCELLWEVLAQPSHHCRTPLQPAEEQCSLDVGHGLKGSIQWGEGFAAIIWPSCALQPGETAHLGR